MSNVRVDFLVALRESGEHGKVQWRLHVLERALAHGIPRSEILRAVRVGEVIEWYPTDWPFPSCLIHAIDTEALHVVAAVDQVGGVCHIITAYRPDLDHFETDLKTRRRRR